MDESVYHFRTALSGYHKGDVTAYIEKTASAHRSELLERERIITELQKENRSLQQQLNLLMMSTPIVTPAPTPAEPAPVAVPEPVVESAPVPVQTADTTSMELQAYRRAEAVEHAANMRAKQLYERLESLCADTIGEFQVTDTAVKQTIELMMQQASALEQAYQALTDTLTASREKLATINEQIPDSE